MLNAISGLETAAESHAAFATGAVLPSGVRIAQSPCTGAVLARPRAFWAADVFGRSRMAARPRTRNRVRGLRHARPPFCQTRERP